jgi:hypothetical protein
MTNKCPNREINCLTCGESFTHANTTLHDNVCKKKRVLCPNEGCGSQVQRIGVKRHRETCGFETVPCKYAKLGCGTSKKRHVISEHEAQDQQHLHMAIDKVAWLEEEVRFLKQRSGIVLKNMESQ